MLDSRSPAVAARGLVKTFGTLRAVDGIDLEVPRGMIFGILGPNGAGKTTLLRMLATLLKPDAGSAWATRTVAARPVSCVSPATAATSRTSTPSVAFTVTLSATPSLAPAESSMRT